MSDNLKREAELIRARLASLPEEEGGAKYIQVAEPIRKRLKPKEKLAAIVLALAEQPSTDPMPAMNEEQQARWAGLMRRAKA